MNERLRPDETKLVGTWVQAAGRTQADAICKRIEQLIQSHLRQIAFDPTAGAWRTLFVDPSDGRYWERIYPHSGLHGGGPPTLSVISRHEAVERYGCEIVGLLDNA